MERHWTASAIPDLSNRNAVVTGAGRQLGKLIIRKLSERGAHVFAVSRDDLAASEFGPNVDVVRMIPTSMESIQRGAERIREDVDHVDILVHAASISIAPRFRTLEGHELMLATNYLGFVMLANELAPAMRNSQAARVVHAGAGMSPRTALDLDRLDADEDIPWETAYAQSRLAAMLFTLELSDRARRSNPSLVSAVAEARETRNGNHPIRRQVQAVMSKIGTPPEDAPARSILFASTSNESVSGQYVAPARRNRVRVDPLATHIPDSVRNAAARQELWDRTEHMLGIRLNVA